MISNITAGTREQIQEIINNNLIPPIRGRLHDADFDTRQEAVWAIRNAAVGGSNEQIEYLVQCNCMKSMIDLLDTTDTKIIVAMDAIEQVLKMGKPKQDEQNLAENPMAKLVEEAGGMQKLEQLQTDTGIKMYENVVKTLEGYSPIEDDNEDLPDDRDNPLMF